MQKHALFIGKGRLRSLKVVWICRKDVRGKIIKGIHSGKKGRGKIIKRMHRSEAGEKDVEMVLRKLQITGDKISSGVIVMNYKSSGVT